MPPSPKTPLNGSAKVMSNQFATQSYTRKPLERFIEASRDFPCPVCRGTSQCKRTTSGNFISCRNETSNNVSGYIFKGVDNKLGWGQYVLEKEEDAEAVADRNQRLAREADQAKAADWRSKDKRVIAQRDKQQRNRFRNYPLTEVDRKDLHLRGLTEEEIANLLIYSTGTGYVIPIRSIDGQCIGGQVRVRKPEVDCPRYVWETTGLNGLCEYDYQLPLTYFYRGGVLPEGQEITQIFLVEGTGVKPYVASKHLDGLVIGAAGGNHLASLLQLRQCLDRYPAAEIVQVLDAGDMMNSQVLGQIVRKSEYFQLIGYENSILWWDQVTKCDEDIDELPLAHFPYMVKLKLADFKKKRDVVHSCLMALAAVVKDKFRKVEVKAKQTFVDIWNGVTSHLSDEHQYIDAESCINKIVEFRLEGYKVILNNSGTGYGKSTLTAKAIDEEVLERLGLTRRLMVDNRYRTPSTPEAERMNVLINVRHNGLAIDPEKKTPLGKPWLSNVTAANLGYARTQGNCEKAPAFAALRDKKLQETNHKICGKCPLFGKCNVSSGDGYGYLYELRKALESVFLSCSMMGLPSINKFGYKDTLVITDDTGIPIKETTYVSAVDFQQGQRVLLASDDPDATILLEFLGPILDRIEHYFGSDIPKHGYCFKDILGDDRPSPELLDKILLIAARHFLPNLEELLVVPDQLEKCESGADRLIKKGCSQADWLLRQQANQTNLEIINELPSAWLIHFIMALKNGNIQFLADGLHIHTPSTRYKEIFKEAGLIIVLDATATRESVAAQMGLDPSEVAVISQEAIPVKNLKVVQIIGMGTPGSQRRGNQLKNATALASALNKRHSGNCAYFDRKQYRNNPAGGCLRGDFWSDTVGSNLYQKCFGLVIGGAMVQNLGSLAVNFSLLTSQIVSPDSQDVSYRQFCNDRIAADHIQAIGRLRANRRLDEQLVVYIINERGDFPINQIMAAFPGATLEVELFLDICPEAARGELHLAQLVYNTVEIMLKKGIQPNQMGIVNSLEEVGFTKKGLESFYQKSDISKLFAKMGGSFKEGIAALIKVIHAANRDGIQYTNSQKADFGALFEPAAANCIQQRMDDQDVPAEELHKEVYGWCHAYSALELSALFVQLKPETVDRIKEICTTSLATAVEGWNLEHSYVLLESYEADSEALQGKIGQEVRWGMKYGLWTGVKTLTEYRLKAITYLREFDPAYQWVKEHALYFQKRLSSAMRGSEKDRLWLQELVPLIG